MAYQVPDDTGCPYNDRQLGAELCTRHDFIDRDDLAGYCLDAPDLIPTGHYVKCEWVVDSEEESDACGFEIGTVLDTFKLAPFTFREI